MDMLKTLVVNVISIMAGQATGWRLQGTSGATGAVSIQEVVSAGGGIGHVYVQDTTKKGHELDYVMGEGGVGTPSPSLPASIDVALKRFPAGGIGQLCWLKQKGGARPPLTLSDLTGTFVEVSVAGNLLAASGSVSFIAMGCPWYQAARALTNPQLAFMHLLTGCEVGGLMVNSSVNISSLGGVGVSTKTGYIADTGYSYFQ